MTARVVSPFGKRTPAREVAQGHDLTGCNVIVTGASSGLGIETARTFVEIGAQVTLAVRDQAAGRAVAADIDAAMAGPPVEVRPLELGDFASIRQFADAWGKTPVHLLINNAGVMGCDQAYTAQNLEMQIGVNHFGHALLTHLLTPNLMDSAQAGKSARVVQLTSGAHRNSTIRWDDMHFRTTPYDRWQAYGQSKTANTLFAIAFNREFRERGVTANAVHPGAIRTPLQRHVTEEERFRLGWAPLDKPSPNLKTIEEGASTTVWAALAPELEGIGGLYLEDCAQALPAEAGQTYGGVWPWALDEADARRLWEYTQQVIR